jgi:hypothetical protein
MTNDKVYIQCPSLNYFPELSEGVEADLVECPKCKKPMWLTARKKKLIVFAALADKDIVLACFDCFDAMDKDAMSLPYGCVPNCS